MRTSSAVFPKKVRATRGGDFTGGFAAAHHGPRIGCLAGLDSGSGRFAGERGLVHEQRPVLQLHIRRHDGALAQMNDIAGHQFLGWQRGPRAVAANAGQHPQLLAQERQRLLRAAFLQQAQRRIQHQQSADHGRLHLLIGERVG